MRGIVTLPTISGKTGGGWWREPRRGRGKAPQGSPRRDKRAKSGYRKRAGTDSPTPARSGRRGLYTQTDQC